MVSEVRKGVWDLPRLACRQHLKGVMQLQWLLQACWYAAAGNAGIG